MEKFASDEDVAKLRRLVDAEKTRIALIMRDPETSAWEHSRLKEEYVWLLDALDIPDAEFIAWVAEQDPELARRIYG